MKNKVKISYKDITKIVKTLVEQEEQSDSEYIEISAEKAKEYLKQNPIVNDFINKVNTTIL